MVAEHRTGMITKQEAMQWVEALRSGDYEQGRTSLKTRDDDNGDRYCCLGVLAELRGVMSLRSLSVGSSCEFRFNQPLWEGCILNSSYSSLPDGWLPRRETEHEANDMQSYLMKLNDIDRLSFDQIADHIEEEIIPLLPDEETKETP